MNFLPSRFSLLLAVLLAAMVPFSFSDAHAFESVTDPALEKTPLPDYEYSPDGDWPDTFLSFSGDQGVSNTPTRQAKKADALDRRRKVDDILRKNPDMPEYMKKAYQAYQQTGDTNIRRFAQAASEFQKQELREQLIEHIDDPEKLNRLMSVLYGKTYSPYKAVGTSGYVLNQTTGEISPGNEGLSATYDKKQQAQTSRKRNVSRKRERRGSHLRENRFGGASRDMKQEYRVARARAVKANRPDLVEELDKMARKNGFID